MKTSNKIVTAAIALQVLLSIGFILPQYLHIQQNKARYQETLDKLKQAEIKTVIIHSPRECSVTQIPPYEKENRQRLILKEYMSRDYTLEITNDTLTVTGDVGVNFLSSRVERFLLNGHPVPIL